jgi:hypothetical protein
MNQERLTGKLLVLVHTGYQYSLKTENNCRIKRFDRVRTYLLKRYIRKGK